MFFSSKLTGKTRKEIDEFRDLKAHLDIKPLEMVDSRDNWSEPSNIALNINIFNINIYYLNIPALTLVTTMKMGGVGLAPPRPLPAVSRPCT